MLKTKETSGAGFWVLDLGRSWRILEVLRTIWSVYDDCGGGLVCGAAGPLGGSGVEGGIAVGLLRPGSVLVAHVCFTDSSQRGKTNIQGFFYFKEIRSNSLVLPEAVYVLCSCSQLHNKLTIVCLCKSY